MNYGIRSTLVGRFAMLYPVCVWHTQSTLNTSPAFANERPNIIPKSVPLPLSRMIWSRRGGESKVSGPRDFLRRSAYPCQPRQSLNWIFFQTANHARFDWDCFHMIREIRMWNGCWDFFIVKWSVLDALLPQVCECSHNANTSLYIKIIYIHKYIS